MAPPGLVEKLHKGERAAASLEVSAGGPGPSAFDEAFDDVKEDEVMRKLDRHVLASFCVLTVLNYLDRTNLAFAALQLNKDLGFSDTVYGMGSSIFFVGYSLFQVPSNLVLLKLGGRTWLSVMLVAWGIVATAFAAMQGPTMFYVLRFLLGLAECGTFPGMWYHLSLFYSPKQIGVAYSKIVAAVVVSQVLGGPLAALLLSLDGMLGLAGWRWLFIMEGVPTIAFGFYLYNTLPDTPETADFLDSDEKAWIARGLQGEKGRGSTNFSTRPWEGAGNWRTLYCAAISFNNAIAKYAILYWCPLIIYSLLDESVPDSHRDWVVALLTGVPFSVAAAATVLIANSAKRTGEQKKHVWIPMAAAGVALFLLPTALSRHPVAAFLLLIPSMLLWANEGVFMSWPATFLHGAAAATGVALINSIGNCGGMVGPLLMGTMKEQVGGFGSAVLVLAMIIGLNTCLAAMFPLPAPATPHTAGAAEKGGSKDGGRGSERKPLLGGGLSSKGRLSKTDSKTDLRID